MPKLVLFICLWSSGYVIGALAIEVADPVTAMAARFALASLVLVPLTARRWRDAPVPRLVVVGLLLQVVQFGGVYGGFALGVPAALSALVMLGLSPLVITALSVASGQERGDARVWAGLAVGVVGVVISLAPELDGARIGAGVALTVLALFGLAGGTVLQKRWPAEPLVSAAVQNATGAVIALPVLAVVGGHVDAGAQLVFSIGWLAWVMGLASLLLLVHLLSRHSASAVSALLLAVPAVTAIASAAVLGEALHPASLLGMAVALVGTGSVLRRARARRPAARAPAARRPRRGGRAAPTAPAPGPGTPGPARSPGAGRPAARAPGCA